METIQSCRELEKTPRRKGTEEMFYSARRPSQTKRSQSLSFIPFVQERDKLGRLISPEQYGSSRSQLPNIQHKNSLDEYQSSEVKEEKIAKAVHSFFRKIDMESKEMMRSRLTSKKLILIAGRDPKLDIYSPSTDCDILKSLERIKLKSKLTESILETKNESPQKYEMKDSVIEVESKSPSKKQSARKRRSNSVFEIGQRNQSPFSNHISNPLSNPLSNPVEKKQHYDRQYKRSESVIDQLKVKLNPEQPEYKRFKQQQEMSLKIFEDYEESHIKFKEKMKESKNIAMKIRNELQIE